MNKRDFIIKYERLAAKVYSIFGRNSIRIAKGNNVSFSNIFMKHVVVDVRGTGNIIEVENGLTRLTNCRITICGSNSHIKIGSKSNLNHCHLYIEDSGGQIMIGQHVTTTGQTNFDVIEGKSITIGDDCLFSSEITFRVGDSHSILDKDTFNRINPSKDIKVGHHVWIGQDVKILKGTVIADNCIVATGAIVTGIIAPPNSIIGGVPARVIKEGITWDAHRIPVGKS